MPMVCVPCPSSSAGCGELKATGVVPLPSMSLRIASHPVYILIALDNPFAPVLHFLVGTHSKDFGLRLARFFPMGPRARAAFAFSIIGGLCVLFELPLPPQRDKEVCFAAVLGILGGSRIDFGSVI